MLRSILVFFIEIMQDVDRAYSSKRFIVMIATCCLISSFYANLLFNLTVEEFMFDSMMYIVIAGLGFIGAEKFRRRDRDRYYGPPPPSHDRYGPPSRRPPPIDEEPYDREC